MKNKNSKGFTLAELLVVVAIIAILVAISIPVFTSQLHNARVATDWANLRSLYAELQTKYYEDGDWSYAKACTVSSDKKTITCGNEKIELEGGYIYVSHNNYQIPGYNYFFYYTCDNSSAESDHGLSHQIIITDTDVQIPS